MRQERIEFACVRRIALYKNAQQQQQHFCEPVWLGGKVLGSLFSSNVVVCGHCLVTLSLTILFRNIKVVLLAAYLNSEVMLVVTV